MKKLLTMCLAVGMLSTTAWAGPADSKANSPMKRLEQAYAEIGQGNHKAALKHLTWCYDKGAEQDTAFVGIRNTYVVDTLAVLGKTYPPAKAALVTRRDAAMAEIGNPPRISLALFDVLALNRALGEIQKNKDILAKCGQDDSVKKFAYAVMDTSPAIDGLDSIVSEETAQQANATFIAAKIDAIESSLGEVAASIAGFEEALKRHQVERSDLEALKAKHLRALQTASRELAASLVAQVYRVEVRIAELVERVIPTETKQVDDGRQRQHSLEGELAHWQAELQRATG